MEVYLPSPRLCGDNAAMVAALGCRMLAAGKRASLEDDVFSRAG
jgi:tRNA A37 threonylcarbamoyltransferase TsaD